MRLTRWSIPTVVLTAALLVALLTPAGRDVAIMAGRFAAVSYCRLLPWVRPPDFLSPVERVADRHKDDPVILQGSAESRFGRELSLRLYERALELRPSDPVLHAGIIRTAMRQHWHEKRLIDQWGIRPDSAARELLKIIKVHSAWGIEHDPENGFFPYMQALVDAMLGDQDMAVERFVAASHSPGYDLYLGQARRAIFNAARARGRTRLGAQLDVLSETSVHFYGAFYRLARRVAEQARKAQAEGRSAEALRLDLAIFRTGRLLSSARGDHGTGLRIMMLAGPQVPKQEINAAAKAEQKSTWAVRFQLQSSMLEKYLLSQGLSRYDVERMREVLVTAERRKLGATSTAMIDRFFCAVGRLDATALLLLLALYSAIGFGILWLILNPATKLLTGGNTTPVGWSTWTSMLLWILLLTPLAAVVVFLVRMPGAFRHFARWVPHSGQLNPSQAVGITVGLLVLVSLALLGETVISILRRRVARLPVRDAAINMAGLVILVLVAACWLSALPPDMAGTQRQVMGGLQIALALMLMFSLLRGWVIAKRNPETMAWRHFLTSLLAACRTVALGSVVLFVVSLYVALPLYVQAVRVTDQYMAMVSG